MENLANKMYDLKRGLALIIGALAIVIASNATSMCVSGTFFEPEMPKSLYMNEE